MVVLWYILDSIRISIQNQVQILWPYTKDATKNSQTLFSPLPVPPKSSLLIRQKALVCCDYPLVRNYPGFHASPCKLAECVCAEITRMLSPTPSHQSELLTSTSGFHSWEFLISTTLLHLLETSASLTHEAVSQTMTILREHEQKWFRQRLNSSPSFFSSPTLLRQETVILNGVAFRKSPAHPRIWFWCSFFSTMGPEVLVRLEALRDNKCRRQISRSLGSPTIYSSASVAVACLRMLSFCPFEDRNFVE